ncbi:hypothetical protein A2Z33_04505 [Candidatus Gottesmanbacteria bacterium RBG_16_52_11]|uniref:Type II secretion system protein GspG C-terminal domain-containing protein n=1 Tax=Candidatus Gottesmanbacteria bacterium RBG_16_52_11 TaxID=1798374 RepID=A0A1F5YWD7_9BACT|nr:MAG: hypothetical protein A2Z33_04505 [Candidatus Gottesmanbacteria bacterium RBG_16_52_11]
MVTDQLLTYVFQRLRDGVPELTVRQDLVAVGWTLEDADTAIARFSKPDEGTGQRAGKQGSGCVSLSTIGCLIVLVLFGIIAYMLGRTLFVINPVTQLDRAKNTRNTANLVQLKTSLSVFYTQNNRYPDTLSELTGGEEVVGLKYSVNEGGQDFQLCTDDNRCITKDDDAAMFADPGSKP